MLRQCWRCNTILCDSCYFHAWGTTSRCNLRGTVPAKWEHQLCSPIPAVAHLCSRCKGISDCCIPGKSWKRCFPTRRWRRNPLCNSWKRCFPTRRRRCHSPVTVNPGSAASPQGGEALLPHEEVAPQPPRKSWKHCFPTRRRRCHPLRNSWKPCFPLRRRRCHPPPTRRRRCNFLVNPGSPASSRGGGAATPSIILESAASPRSGGAAAPFDEEAALPLPSTYLAHDSGY